MMLAIYIVVILECYYAFKERKIRPVETLSSKCFLWRALLTMSEREMRQRGSPVRLPGSLLWTLWRMASIVFTWSFCIFSDDCTEPSEEGSRLPECGECLQLRCDLIQYCFPKKHLLDFAEGGPLSAQMEQGLFDTFRFKNTVKGKANEFHNYL